MVAAHRLTPLVRGWFALSAPTTIEERHALTTRALLRARRRRAGRLGA